MRKNIPVYDICAIDSKSNSHVLVERLSEYLSKHYSHLHKAHRHSFYHIVLFTSGKGKHTIDFDTFKVEKNQLYFMAPGQVHSWHFEGDMEGYIVNFEPELFSAFLLKQDHVQQYPFFNGISKDGVITIASGATRKELVDLFERLLNEANRQPLSIDMIRLLLLELFIIVQRCCTSDIVDDASNSSAVLVKHFRQLVEKNFRKFKLPKDYAQLLFVTPNHLNAVCKNVLGVTAGEIIRDRVLLEAKRLLTNADMDVSEISFDLNFDDNSYFTRFFKKYAGVTPEQFRKTINR